MTVMKNKPGTGQHTLAADLPLAGFLLGLSLFLMLVLLVLLLQSQSTLALGQNG